MVMPIYYKAVAAVEKLSAGDVKEMSLVNQPSEGLKIPFLLLYIYENLSSW